MIGELALQFCQMTLVVILAPAVVGLVRKTKARLQRRIGPPILQPYRDLRRLFGKEVVLPENASWLFRVTPYLIFALTWVAVALVPTFRTGLLFSWCGDLIAIVALLGAARFLQALVALDVGTSFGGIGSSREVMIASLAEPAMIMVVFTVALVAGSTQLSTIADFMVPVGRPARSLAWRSSPSSWWRSPRTPASRSTIPPPISNSPWSTRRWCWNIPAGTGA